MDLTPLWQKCCGIKVFNASKKVKLWTLETKQFCHWQDAVLFVWYGPMGKWNKGSYWLHVFFNDIFCSGPIKLMLFNLFLIYNCLFLAEYFIWGMETHSTLIIWWGGGRDGGFFGYWMQLVLFYSRLNIGKIHYCSEGSFHRALLGVDLSVCGSPAFKVAGTGQSGGTRSFLEILLLFPASLRGQLAPHYVIIR